MDPSYSALLDALTKTPEERNNLLRSYFEPTTAEREDGQKVPSSSHRAIANLVRDGYIRVIVTTNFDKLLETALRDEGVHPVVVSTDSAAKGCQPLAHGRCTILKVNGDYLDRRFKNTPDELAAYGTSMRRLLRQVFDEYGLIVCGWSADYDTALTETLMRCSSHRFGTYWCIHGKGPSDSASNLIANRKAGKVTITSADVFFSDLSSKVMNLSVVDARSHPLSAHLATTQIKRHLGSGKLIDARDLIAAEVRRALPPLGALSKDEKPPTEFAERSKVVIERLAYYEHHCESLFSLTTTVALFSPAERFDDMVLEGFKRTLTLRPNTTGYEPWAHLQLYPAHWILYGVGLACVSSGNYRLFKKLLYLPVRLTLNETYAPAITLFYRPHVFWDDANVPIAGNRITAVSRLFLERLRSSVEEFLPDEVDYRDKFDWLEYPAGPCLHRLQDQNEAEGKRVGTHGTVHI